MSDTLVLQPRLDLAAAEPLAEALKSRLGADITIDARQVTHLGAICLQVLLATAKTLRRAGHELTIVNVSDRVLDQLSALGFTPETLAEAGT
jgi:chemotaxis protein CheX